MSSTISVLNNNNSNQLNNQNNQSNTNCNQNIKVSYNKIATL